MSNESNSAPRTRKTALESIGIAIVLPPILGIFLTVFLDLLSFGMFIPDLQLRVHEITAKYYGLPADSHDPRIMTMIGLSLGVFSFAQLLTAPFLGRLSDRIGRRKVLLVTTILSTVSYVLYAHATSLEWIFISRIFGGIGAANLGVAFAYIADVTKPEERAKGLGLIGAAFGLGFVLGPLFGTQLLKWGNNLPVLLGYAAAGMCFVNLLYIWLFLPESLQAKVEAGGHFFSDLKKAVSTPGLGLLLAMFFVANFGFTNLETTYFQLLADDRSVFHLGHAMAREYGGYILALVGVVAAFTQGFLVNKLMPLHGEVNLIRFSYPLLILSFVMIPFAPLWIPCLLAVIVLGVSNGLAQPSLSSLISRLAPPDVQGGIFGISQALGALARCIGPLIGNSLFGYQPYYPYLLGALLILFPTLAAWRLRQPTVAANPESVLAH